MLRWMMSPVILGAGEDDYTRAAVSDLQNVNSSSVISTHDSGPDIGLPKYRFCLSLCATPNVNSLRSVSNGYIFPDYNLDGRMSGMESEARTGLVQSVQAYNLDGNGLHLDATHADTDSYRDLITKIGKQFDQAFTVNAMGIAEVAA